MTKINNGTIEAMKWLAMVLMVIDHVNKYLLHDRYLIMFDAGRVAMPIFAFVFAYNMANTDHQLSAITKLCVYGLIAEPAFIGLGGLYHIWYPLNIMFMLLTVAIIINLKKSDTFWHKFAQILVFVVGGGLVEFWWFAVAMTLSVYTYYKTKKKRWIFLAILFTASLEIVNRNYWACAAIPIILLGPYITINAPRKKYLFYVFYPAHLWVLFAIKSLIA